MDEIKVSELPVAESVNDEDLIMIVQNGANKKATKNVVVPVVDNLTSTSETDALSANQGRILNEKFNYSLTEQIIGTWIDGKPLYRKVISVGALPNATEKIVPHNINNLETIVRLSGISKLPSSGVFYTLPNVNENATNLQVSLRCNNINITIGAGIDRSAFTETYVIIEYTKTTD